MRVGNSRKISVTLIHKSHVIKSSTSQKLGHKFPAADVKKEYSYRNQKQIHCYSLETSQDVSLRKDSV